MKLHRCPECGRRHSSGGSVYCEDCLESYRERLEDRAEAEGDLTQAKEHLERYWEWRAGTD